MLLRNGRCVHAIRCYCGFPRSCDGSERNGISQTHDRHNRSADPPCPSNIGWLEAFRKEEIEEEGRSKDGGHRDSNEDVVRGDANKVIIVDGC